MNQLTAINQELPAKLEDLTRFVLIGREKLTAVRAEIRAIDKLDLAKEVREQKRDEAQMLAEALLDAEAKIGEILREIPKATGGRPFHTVDTAVDSKPESKKETIKELGFTQKQAERFEILAEYKDVIEQVKAEAKENDDLPTRAEVLKRIAERKREEHKKSLKEMPFPVNKFQVIYCDPPWEYSNTGFAMSVEKQYPTMPTEKIAQMPIKEITAGNAVIFMWATNPLLEDALHVMRAWGFEYKTNMAWVKDRHTAGFYVFGQHELLLIGVKGSLLPTGEKAKSIITGSNNIHSKKPEIVYSIIEKMYPGLKYVELFARNEPRPNWTKWGNEVGKYEQ